MKYLFIVFFAILPIFSHTMEIQYEPFLKDQIEIEKQAKKNKEYVNIPLHKMTNIEVIVYYQNKLNRQFKQQKFKAFFSQIQRLKQ